MVLVQIVLFFLYIAAICASSWSNQISYVDHGEKSLHVYTNPKNKYRDLPKQRDIDSLMESLKRIINFCETHKNFVDLNFGFGLFLANVNLKTVLRQKSGKIPEYLADRIESIVRRNSELLDFLHKMATKSGPDQYRNQAIYSLWSNDTAWSIRVQMYEEALMSYKPGHDHHPSFAHRPWDTYFEKMMDETTYIPNPIESDECFISIAESPVKADGKQNLCSPYGFCYSILEYGNNDGYSLTHRLLLLLVARYGKGCSIFSWAKDHQLSSQFCATAYEEAHYIVKNNNVNKDLVDLLAEQMALCALNNHVEFLQRHWLAEVMMHQKQEGCFGVGLSKMKSKKYKQSQWKFSRWMDDKIKGSSCSGHQTATAAAILSSAIRYIVASEMEPAAYIAADNTLDPSYRI